jgi:hypothetical protein
MQDFKKSGRNMQKHDNYYALAARLVPGAYSAYATVESTNNGENKQATG